MRAHENLIKMDLDWHRSNPQQAPNPDFAAGFVAGMNQALEICRKFPDWEHVSECLMDTLTIQNAVFDSMPTDLEDMISEDEVARVDAAYESYNEARKAYAGEVEVRPI